MSEVVKYMYQPIVKPYNEDPFLKNFDHLNLFFFNFLNITVAWKLNTYLKSKLKSDYSTFEDKKHNSVLNKTGSSFS